MRIAILTIAVLIPASGFAAFHRHKAKVDPALNAIHKVYVKGTNEAASNIRQEMLWDANKYGDESCFTVVGKEAAADAVLEVEEQQHSSTLSTLGSADGPVVSAMVVSGTLTDSKGDLLWSDSERDEAGLAVIKYRKPEQNLLRALYRKACGNANGRR